MFLQSVANESEPSGMKKMTRPPRQPGDTAQAHPQGDVIDQPAADSGDGAAR